jgi:starch synthase
MNTKIKILYAASEATPFISTGGLGEVAGSLTKSLNEQFNDMLDIRVIIPFYQGFNYKNEFEFLGNITVPLSWRNQYCGIFKKTANNITYYFIDNEYYFKRNECYGYMDDGERFAFFSKAVLSILPIIDFFPNIIHSNDWQTALIPIYLKTKYFNNPMYSNIKTIITIHNIEYQGKFNLNYAEDIYELNNNEKNIIEYNGEINLLKGAMETCDIISTVSYTYSKEIFDDYYAKGLAEVIRRNKHKIIGILNGIDTVNYNPETDLALFNNYNVESLDKKTVNKINLQSMLGLPQNSSVPVIAIISRLVSHKGMDLITNGIEEILKEKVQFIILGKGERGYELFFKSLQDRYHDKVSVRIDFNNDMARKIYAGADMFLMPSISEPCGIAQMIASRYGTVPIVRETGGLKDSIKDCSTGAGNGFTFSENNSEALVATIKRALAVYNNKDQWEELVKSVMAIDFSWNKSAEEYYKMYLSLKE